MRDRREELLARLVEVCEGIPGVKLVDRNRTDVGRAQRPALIVQDGDESVSEDRDLDRHGRPATAAERVEMSPEVVIMAGSAADANVGSVLNGFRRLLIRAVREDAVLAELTGRNGFIKYIGVVTDLARGREMEGAMVMTFTLRYLLKTEELS